MAHGITNRDNVFAVRREMWHGLGTVLEDYPTREEAQRLVHPWEPETEPLYRRRQSVTVRESGDVEAEDYFEEVSSGVLNVRSDTQEELATVSKTFVTVSNNEMYDVVEAIESGDPGAVQYETGGTLFGGKKVWLMIRLKEPINVHGDPNGLVVPYFAIQNSHDGSGAFRGQAVLNRIVCANTAQAADLMAAEMGTEFTFSHTKKVQERIEEAKKALAGWRKAITQFQETAEEMIKTPVTHHQRELFLEKFIPMPLPSATTERVRLNVNEARDLVRGFLNSETCEGIENTTYGLVQASVEYLNHARKANSQESRFKRAYLDRSAITRDAVQYAREVVSA